MDMLYKYKEAFSLKDEIGTCPNIEVEIEVMDRSPFFIRPYHVRKEDKVVIDKEMKRLCSRLLALTHIIKSKAEPATTRIK